MHPIAREIGRKIQQECLVKERVAAEIGINGRTLDRFLEGQIKNPRKGTLDRMAALLHGPIRGIGTWSVVVDGVEYEVVLRRKT